MYIAVSILILLFAALFFINITIKLYFSSALPEFNASFEITGIKIKIKRKSNVKIKIYYNIVKYIAEHIKVKYFLLNILFGSDDAALDVLTVQFFRNIVFDVCKLLKNSFKNTEMHVNIMPAFNQTVFNANFNSIISVRIGYIIIAYIRHYIIIIKNKIRRSFK